VRPEKSLAEALGPSTRERIEQLFQLLEAATGRWRLELEAEDGHL
jgi:hypothetical protein